MPALRLSDFKIGKLLGAGSFGEVHRAREKNKIARARANTKGKKINRIEERFCKIFEKI